MLLLIPLAALVAASMISLWGRRMLYIASFFAGLLVAGLIVWLISICDSEMRSADRSEQP